MNTLFTIVTALAVTFGGLLGLNAPQNVIDNAPREDALGSDIKLLAGFTYYLAGTGISSSGTSFTLTNFTIKQNGYEIQDSDLEDTFYFTLEPGNPTRQEILACTTVVQNADNTATISGCSRGMAPIQPYSASTTLQFAHAGGSAAILSDPPQLFDELYDYVNSLALGSTTVSATTLAAGFVELATQAEMAASAILGGSGSSLVLQAQYATSTAPASGNYIPVTGSDGNLAEGFLPTTISQGTTFASATITTLSSPNLSRIVATTSASSTPYEGYHFDKTIPAIGVNGMVKGFLPITSMVCNNSGGDLIFDVYVYYGSSVGQTSIVCAEPTSGASGFVEFFIAATSTNGQYINVSSVVGFNTLDDAAPAYSSSVHTGTAYGTMDVTTSQTLRVLVSVPGGGGYSAATGFGYAELLKAF